MAECMPDLLPLLAECAFIWNTRETFTRLYELLTRWGPIQPETALELLDFKYPDREIREFAVRCLDEALDNDRLQLYVMPLVQVAFAPLSVILKVGCAYTLSGGSPLVNLFLNCQFVFFYS